MSITEHLARYPLALSADAAATTAPLEPATERERSRVAREGRSALTAAASLTCGSSATTRPAWRGAVTRPASWSSWSPTRWPRARTRCSPPARCSRTTAGRRQRPRPGRAGLSPGVGRPAAGRSRTATCCWIALLGANRALDDTREAARDAGRAGGRAAGGQAASLPDHLWRLRPGGRGWLCAGARRAAASSAPRRI